MERGPGASLRLFARKLAFVFNNSEIPDSSDAVFVRLAAAPSLAWGWIRFGMLLPLGALCLGSERRSPFMTFVVLVVLIGLLSTAAFFVVGRYRVPWAPALILLAAGGITDLARLIRERRWRSLARYAGMFVVPAAILAWWPQDDLVAERWAHSEIDLAIAYTEAGQVQAVIDALDDARAIGTNGAAEVDALLRGDYRRHLTKAMDGPLAWARGLERARLLRQLPEGRIEVRRLIDAAQRADPRDPAALRESGPWWLGEIAEPANRERAKADLRQAARGQPGDPSAALMLSLLEKDSTLLLSPAVKAGAGSVRYRIIRRILEDR